MSLRESALVGMIEEYARHVRHAECCASGSTVASASSPTDRSTRPAERRVLVVGVDDLVGLAVDAVELVLGEVAVLALLA